jgi:hypothetical protein
MANGKIKTVVLSIEQTVHENQTMQKLQEEFLVLKSVNER